MKKNFWVLFLAGVLMITGGIGCSKADKNRANADIEKSEPAYYSELGFESVEEEGKLLAFPGAEGYGKYTAGGRGGKVIEVTNLNDSGEGSLRAAIEAEGARIVVFKVSGDIMLESNLKIENPNITIAGQTAPGDGICLRNYGLIIESDQVIVRYLRSRPANVIDSCDCVWVNKAENVIVDHVSASFATDENLSVADSTNVTVQNCIIAESLNKTKLGTHGMGSLIRGSKGQKVTYYGNLYASHRSRMPMAGNYTEYTEDPEGLYMEFINNLLYNWNGQSCGKSHDVNCVSSFNLINNCYISGPCSDTEKAFVWSEGCSKNHMYMEGNSMNGEVVEDQYSLVEVEMEDGNEPFSWDYYKMEGRFEHSLTEKVLSAEEVYTKIKETAGCSISRDDFDLGIIQIIENGTGDLVNKPEEAAGWKGSWPVLETTETYTDEDKDGMDDAWEKKVGLDGSDASDGNKTVAGGYTNLEVFLESLKK